MNRTYLKDKAKQVLSKDFWYLVGIVLICAFLTMELIGFETKIINEYDVTYTAYYLKILTMNIPIDPDAWMINVGFVVFAVNVLMGLFVRPLAEYGKANVFKYASKDRRDFNLFAGVNENYLNIIIVNVIANILIGLFTLAFVIPGIMKALELRYINEILEEHPDWHYKEVFAESKRMTSGLKMELFILDLSFFGWYLAVGLLNVITLGLASLALQTYINATNAEAYHWIKEAKGISDIEVEVSYMKEEEVL